MGMKKKSRYSQIRGNRRICHKHQHKGMVKGVLYTERGKKEPWKMMRKEKSGSKNIGKCNRLLKLFLNF